MMALLSIVSVLLLLASAALLWRGARGHQDPQRITQRRLHEILHIEADTDKDPSTPLARLLKRVGTRRDGTDRRLAAWRDELRSLLTQAGWYDRDTRAIIKGAVVFLPFVSALLAAAVAVGSRWTSAQSVAIIFLGFGAGVLLPRVLLRQRAVRRREEIVEEVPIMVRMISVLFEAGLSMEVALKTLRDNGAGVLPNLSVEIGRMLARVESGMDRVEALNLMARELDIQELSDAVAVLSHTAVAGGSVRQSLARIADVIEDQNRTRLRERVGKLSAKMTVVMVVFLFPALFIFLAGPGLTAIGSALGGIR